MGCRRSIVAWGQALEASDPVAAAPISRDLGDVEPFLAGFCAHDEQVWSAKRCLAEIAEALLPMRERGGA